MKQSKTMKNLERFVYIDSSEEEEESQGYKNNLQSKGKNVNRVCKIDLADRQQQGDFKKQLTDIVKNQIEKLKYGNAIMVEPNDKQIAQNVRKRQEKYQYFLHQIGIDEKYNNIITKKVQKLRKQNQRKQQILKKKRTQDMFKEEEQNFRKYLIQKREKQEKVKVGLNKVVHELGVERNIQTAKRVIKVVQEQRIITSDKLDDLKIRQRNELQELRQKYEAAKQQKKINKSDQHKVLKDLELKNRQVKKSLEQQLVIRKNFIV